jgi:hypothetical protein
VSTAALEDALRSIGTDVRVEQRDRLAVLAATADDALPDLSDAATRRAIVALASRHGFTHVALELADEAERAPLPRD